MQERGECIRAFLLAPLSPRRFRTFFDLCCATTIGLLKYYRSRGYPVPIERADTQAGYYDLACELLGEFFRGSADEPFALIFDYFARHGGDDFKTAPAEDLYDHFRVLLSGFVKKQLFRRRKTENPQAEILKRRIKDILSPPEYVRFRHNPADHMMVARADRRDVLRIEAPPLPYAALEDVVAQTYQESHTRTGWCRAVFDRLDLEAGYRNFLRLNDLLLAMVQVNATALDELVPESSQYASPVLDTLRRAVETAVRDTVTWAAEGIVPQFIQRGRLQATESEPYLRAVELYLIDLGFSGGADPLPRYFREVMPSAAHGKYLADYKYTFEAVITRSTDRFRELLAREVT